MKYKIIGLCLFVLFIACNNNKMQGQNTQNEKILSVEIAHFGGMAGLDEKLIFTKDSIHYYVSVFRPNIIKKEYHTIIPDSLWKNILSMCNLNKFAAMPSGKSQLPTDYPDIQIIIKTDQREISVLNGEWYDDKMFNLLRNTMKNYYNTIMNNKN
jgi:hypothetical protein